MNDGTDNVILNAEKISKIFPGVVALDKVDFKLEKGSVHALMGENGAGKSTLMKIFAGIYQPDEGTITLRGEEVEFANPSKALQSGIAMIHQELSPVLDLTVVENLFLGREITKNGMLDYRSMTVKAKELLSDLGIQIDPTRKMRGLSTSQMQIIEIAKALSTKSDIFIMDEPSSSITDREVDSLHEIILRLKKDGKAIVYITHKMDEVFKIADTITILRDGEYIGTYPAADLSEHELITLMVNRELNEIYPPRSNTVGESTLRVEHLSQAGAFQDISFEAHRGEILGFYGLIGSGRTEVMNAIFGITKPDSGSVHIGEKAVSKARPSKVNDMGVGYVTEDRKGNGLILSMSVYDNILLPSLKKLSGPLGWVKKDTCDKKATEYKEKLTIKTPTMQQLVNHLSGGNQQKVVLAKWLLQDPEIIIFDEATRGIDIGAKTEIYRFVVQLAQAGKTILYISSELPEILGMCDRTIVFYEGRKMGEVQRDSMSQESIMTYAAGVEQ